MVIHKDSHTDHAITQAQWAFILQQFKDRSSFFIETIELPPGLGHVMNGLYGPSCGDGGITEDSVYYAPRPPRIWDSRMTKMPARPTRFVRVIAGPHKEVCDPAHHWPKQCVLCDGAGVIVHACILYTAYGVSSKDMPYAPKEPGDLHKQIADLTLLYEAARGQGTATVEDHEALHRLHVMLKASKEFWSTHALASE